MKVISFDVGIKNMAYCVLSIDPENQLKIEEWSILNLMDTEPPPNNFKCTCILINKTIQKNNKIKKNKIKNNKINDILIDNQNIVKDTITGICGKPAKYLNNNQLQETHYYCEKHAKLNNDYFIPKKEYSAAYINKLKKEQLVDIYNTIFNTNVTNNTKPVLLEKILNYYRQKCFTSINSTKLKNASETNLIMIGKNMKKLLNSIPTIQDNIRDITHVLIENQISPIANRMKTIQGMLAQYFIMKCPNDIHIEFVSSVNKLKLFSNIVNTKYADVTLTSNLKNNYNKNKKNGIDICSQLIENNESLIKWNTVLKTKKKDDYADSFLQGFWYLTHHNIINYADNLKIYII